MPGDLHIPKLTQSEVDSIADIHMRALLLMQVYPRQGHYSAVLDPLGLVKPTRYNLNLADHGLSEADLERTVTTMVAGRQVTGKLRDLVLRMEKTYCSSIGAEFFEHSRRGSPGLAH